MNGVYWDYNLLILTFDPNFQVDIQVESPYPSTWFGSSQDWFQWKTMDNFIPLRIRLWDPFQMAMKTACKWGLILTTYDTWDDPPSN